MRLLVVASVVFLSCASPSATAYADGAPLRPPAPVVPIPGHTPPGTGLPEYWRPPQPQRPPEPVPERALPETPESRKGPGLWSTSGPSASIGGMPKIMGIPFPFPPEMEMDEMGPHLACAELMTRALSLVPEAAAFEARLTDVQRKCMSASLYDICEQEALRGNKEAKSEGLYDAVLFNKIKAAAERTAAHRAATCRGVPMPKDSDDVAEAAYLRLLELLKQFERPAP